MSVSRRSFMTAIGASVAIAATRRSRAAAQLTAREEAKMEITRIGSRPSIKGPADWFTGTARIDPLLQPQAPARAAGSYVTFEPGPGRRGTPTRWARP
jgi:hypothetical protein